MSDSDELPRFRRPPVGEVAVGMQFSAPGFQPTHYGMFYERVKHEFPTVEVLPPLPAILEMFSPPQGGMPLPGVQFVFGPQAWPLPRVLFVSADDCSLVQLQSDQLFFNWRRRQNSEYAHYAFIRDGFSKAFSAFQAFAEEQKFGPLIPSQCEIAYVNPLPLVATGVEPSYPEEVFRVWSSAVGEEWREPLEDLAYNARYPFLDDSGTPFGRLTVGMSTQPTAENVKEMRLELVARGAPRGPGLEGVLAFHDIGHDAIVRCFAGITTPAMHARWERYQ